MRRFIAPIIAGVGLLIWFLVSLFSDVSVQKAVSRDAIDKALHWGSYMSSHIPDIEGLVQTGLPTDDQRDAIRGLRQLGDVFRFKLFDDQGRLVLVSDEESISDPIGIATEFDPEPLSVVETGTHIVAVYDGTEKADRPDLYAEAYIPLVDDGGRTFGVVEVYINETMTQKYFTDSFKTFGWIVSAISALLFLLPMFAFGIQRKQTEKSRSKAEYLSKFDPLTGLLNRAEFTRRAEVLIEDGHLTALLFIDADKFKAINDTYGHAAGDRLLEHIGRHLAANTDAEDLVARFGGDEFVVAVRDGDQTSVMRLVRRILTEVAQPVEVDGRTIKGSISVGVSFAEGDADLDAVMAQSDVALYYAKSAGRNQHALYGDDMGTEIRRRNELEDRIRQAAAKKEFKLVYQPLVSGKDTKPIGYEALMRLQMPDGTNISPEEFIPMAEEIGLIDEIGAWALFEATQKISQMPGVPSIAINLSVAQFKSGRLPQLVKEALAASGLTADRLELEITESLLLDDNVDVAFQIDTIQDMGVSIAMDDFGTGFSSLGYLWKFGFDRIKIDRSFIAGLEDNSNRSLEIVETVIMLGKRLGMEVTAEGVETEAQSDVLTNLGCDVLQGYYFGRPADISDHLLKSKAERAG